MRKFEIVEDFAIQYGVKDIKMPIRSTKNSAGYDIFSPIDFTIDGNGVYQISTNLKAQMGTNEFLLLCTTSGMGKRGIKMANAIGIIDSDFYGNVSNDGNISFRLQNTNSEPYSFKKGEKIGQGIFMNFLKTDDDIEVDVERTGGFGSTDKNN